MHIYLHKIFIWFRIFPQPNEKPWETEKRMESNQKKKYTQVFQCGNKNKFCVLHLIWRTLCLSFSLSLSIQSGEKEKTKISCVVRRCLHRLSFGVALNKSTQNPKYFYMKCAAIREDFLSAITEPAKCMEIKQQQHRKKTYHIQNKEQRETERNSNPKCLLWLRFLYAAIAHCNGVVLDKLLHYTFSGLCVYMWYFSFTC